MLAVVVVGMLIAYLKSQDGNSEQAENQVPLVSEASEIIPVGPQFLNEPGHWDVFISHTQRNPAAVGT